MRNKVAKLLRRISKDKGKKGNGEFTSSRTYKKLKADYKKEKRIF